MKSIIYTENLTKIYGKGEASVKALDNINISFERGKMTAIIGTSGSGKSTLLNIIGGLDTSADGKVYYENKNILTMKDYELAELRNTKIGYIFQFFKLIPELSAIENILLPSMIAKKKQDKYTIKKLTDKLEITDRLSHFPSQLSGGQQQRVAIARAIVNNPDVILCDEPTGALDKKTSIDIMNLFKSLNEEGKTIIMVTHNIEIANQCDKIIEISDGLIDK